MKRSVKNVIMIGMAAVLIGTSAITFSYARDNSPEFAVQSQSQQFEKRDANGNSQENPIDNFGNGSQNSNSDSENSQNSQQFGQRPQTPPSDNQQSDSQNSQQPPQMQGDDSQNSQQPPSLPDSEQQQDNASPNEEGTSSDSEELNIIGTVSDSDSAEITDAAKKMPSHGQRNNGSDAVSVLCYLFGALQVGIIIAIIAYLIVSKFNKISFNKLFGDKPSINPKQ